MSNRAWVTLATNDSYGLGALVLAHSLRRANSAYPAVVLVTPSVTDAMRNRLSAVFAEVISVDVLDSRDATHLALLQRPELGITFTKIHCWSLTQYQKCVFLDADALIVQNCDELFEREELSAAPDVGWPDCFNSGVFVFVPSYDTYTRLITFAQERGSFDGGDQGLLNAFFSDWAHGDINKHLPFLYNVTSAAFYSYIPALKHYGQDLKIIHFIGAAKPWLQQFNWDSRSVDAPEHLSQFLQSWWDIFVGQVHSQLDSTMESVDVIEEALPTTPPPEVPPEDTQYHYEPTLDPESEFAWHHPKAQPQETETQCNDVHLANVHDPWKYYRGHIPPKKDFSSDKDVVQNEEEIRKYAQEYQSSYQNVTSQKSEGPDYWQHKTDHTHHGHEAFHQHKHNQDNREPVHSNWEGYTQHHQWEDHSHQQNHDHQNHHDHKQHHDHSYYNDHHQSPQDQHERYYHESQTHTDKNTSQTFHSYQHENFQGSSLHSDTNHQSQFQDQSDHSHQISQKHDHETVIYPEIHSHVHSYNESQTSNIYFENHSDHRSEYFQANHFNPFTTQPLVQQVYYVHLDHRRRIRKRVKHDHVCSRQVNGHISDSESEDEFIIPRHPYDGFYLRHRPTIDSRGRKMCSHEIPPTPSPSPPESELDDYSSQRSLTPTEEFDTASECEYLDSGVAGNLARVTPGAGGQQREAIDELTRRQGWEAGNIDYMGADSFDNIWAKISQTLNQPKQPSAPRKEPTPPKEEAQPAATEAAVETPVSEVPVAPDAVPEAPVAAAPEAPVAAAPEAPATATPEAPVAAAPAEAVAAAAAAPVAQSPAATEVPTTPTAEALAQSVVEPPVAPFVETPVAPVPKTTPVPAEMPAAPTTEAPAVPVPEAPAVTTPVESAPAPEAAPAVTEGPKEVPVVPQQAAKDVAATPPPAEVPTTVEEALASEPAPAAAATEVKEKTAPETAAAPAAPVSAAEVTAKVVPSTPPSSPTAASDSPPLAHTPSKEEAPAVPAAAKSEERRKPAGKLQLSPPAAGDALPTPDSELEDAAALAQSIINSELRLLATAPSPAADLPCPPLLQQEQERLSVAQPQVPTPPVSLAQIGVKPKEKATTAEQIASSLTEKTESAPAAPTTVDSTVAPAPPEPASPAPVQSVSAAPAAAVDPASPALAEPVSKVAPTTSAPVEPASAAPAKVAAPATTVVEPACPAPAEPASPAPAEPATPTTAEPASPTSAAPSEAPKKKVAKKGAKKEAAPSGDAAMPVPPPRKKEKKPKEK